MRASFNEALATDSVEQAKTGAHKGKVRPVESLELGKSAAMHKAYHAPHAIDPDAPMPGNVTGTFAKPCYMGSKSKSGNSKMGGKY